MQLGTKYVGPTLVVVFVSFAVGQLLSGQPIPPEIQQRLKQTADFRSLRASIEQTILETGRKKEVYKGKYIADSTGRIRIDYFEPSPQSIIYNGKKLMWVYYNEKYAWEIPSNLASRMLPSGPAATRANIFQDYSVDFVGQARVGVRPVFEFTLKPKKNSNYSGIQLFLNRATLTIARRIVFDDKGREFFTEDFSNYTTIKGIHVPGMVEVALRQGSRKLINKTQYSNYEVNIPIPKYYFRFTKPAGFTIRQYGN